MGTRKIADYTITRELGRGGMGTVYQALSREGATVAIKTVLWPEDVDPRGRWEAIEPFQREARAARAPQARDTAPDRRGLPPKATS